MDNKIERSGQHTASGFFILLLHAGCFLLVVFYVNMYQFWAFVFRQLGPGPLLRGLPVIVTLLVLFVIFLKFAQRVKQGHSINLIFLTAGIVGAFIALAIPDPNIPIKRIHVAEYIILSFLVRYTLSQRLQGPGLTVFTILVVILLGVHDEMLQGFHPKRYYGWLDMVVNAVAGMSGALLGHALFCFERAGPRKGAGQVKRLLNVNIVFLYVLLYCSVVILIIALFDLHGAVVPWSLVLPLATVSLLIAVLHPRIIVDSMQHHGLQAVYWLASSMIAYPLLIHIAGMEFV